MGRCPDRPDGILMTHHEFLAFASPYTAEIHNKSFPENMARLRDFSFIPISLHSSLHTWFGEAPLALRTVLPWLLRVLLRTQRTCCTSNSHVQGPRSAWPQLTFKELLRTSDIGHGSSGCSHLTVSLKCVCVPCSPYCFCGVSSRRRGNVFFTPLSVIRKSPLCPPQVFKSQLSKTSIPFNTHTLRTC